MFWHGDVFGSAGGLDLEEIRDVKLRRAPEGTERRVFMYRQTMDIEGRAEPLPVVGSSFRVMTEGEPDSGAADVVYVAGRVATRPAGGLPAARVTPAEALAAARAHERGRGLETWSEPELVAIYDDAPAGDGVAYPAWRLHGVGESFLTSHAFYVDAVSGVVVRDHSNIAHAHASGDIEGKVTGNATPGLQPDIPFTSDPNELWFGCDNEPDLFDLVDVQVTAYEESTMQTLVSADSTDEFGDYTLAIPTTQAVHVFAELKRGEWVVLDGTTGSAFVWDSEPVPPLRHTGNPVTAPATGVDLQFNSSPTEKSTAFVNAHLAMSKTVRWLDLDVNAMPTAPVVVHVDVTGFCDAAFYPMSFTGQMWPGGGIAFSKSTDPCTASGTLYGHSLVNQAYSTVVAHEYGHYVVWNLMGIEITLGTQAFHEGFGDALALLVYDTEIFSEDFAGCDEDGRWPRNPDTTRKAVFPRCPASPSDCSTDHSSGHHCRGELLAALWRDLDQELGNAAVQELFLDWIMIAQAPTADECSSGHPDQAADQGTLLEVLSVAAEGYRDTICNVFENVRLISHPDPPCADSAGWFCYADCDGNAVLDFWDFLCFQSAFGTGETYSDCDGDGVFTFFDFLCFQNSFVAGCS